MPSFLHEALVLLLANRVLVVPELLRMAKLLRVPRFSSARIESVDFSELVPAEYRADLLVVLRSGDEPVLGIITEVQLEPDERKRYTWPYYQASARAKYECDMVVLVVAPKPHTARWARKTVRLGGQNTWAPLVLGPEDVPRLTDPEKARQLPELGVLSVMAHGRGEPDQALRIAAATFQGLESIPDEETRVLYYDLIDAHLGEAARKALAMIPEGYQYQSKFGNRRFEEGKAEGRAEGKAEGKAEGRAEGLRAVVRKLLTLKFGELDAGVEARLARATEPELDVWAERVLGAASVDEVVGG